MNSEGRLLDEIELENGLTLFFYDRSKPIAGGRFQVQLLAMVPIPSSVCRSCGHGNPIEIDKEFLQEQGQSTVFTVEKTRNFIAREEMSAVLERMKQEFLASNVEYLGHRSFARKFVEKSYREWKKNRELMDSQAMAIKNRST